MALSREWKANGNLGDLLELDATDSISDDDETQLGTLLDRLLDTQDSVADLLTFESMYQSVKGNFDRGGAALEAVSGNMKPPEIESINTPVPSTKLEHNVVFLLPPGNQVLAANNPKGSAEPRVNQWMDNLLGDLNLIGCSFDFDAGSRINVNTADEPLLQTINGIGPATAQSIRDHIDAGHLFERVSDFMSFISSTDVEIRKSVTLENRRLSLSELGILPIDFLYLSAFPAEGEEREIDRHIALWIRKEFGLNHDEEVRIDLISSQGFTWSIAQAMEMGRQIMKTCGGRTSLAPHHISLPENAENASYSDADIGELRNRLENDSGESLNDYLTDLISRIESVGDDQIDQVIDLLKEASSFRLGNAIPVAPDDPDITDLKENALNELKKKNEAITELLNELDTMPTDSGENRKKIIDKLIEAYRILFGKEFLILPTFSAHNPDALVSAYNQPNILNGLGQDRIMLWLQQWAQLQPALYQLENLAMLVDTWNQELNDTYQLSFNVAQFPQNDDLPWLALSNAEAGITPKDRPNSAFSILFTEINTDSLGVLRDATPLEQAHLTNLAGWHLDQLSEQVATDEIDASVGFQYDGPNNQAPQSLLLAVPGNREHDDPYWSGAELRDIVKDTLDLAKIRAVDLDALRDVGFMIPSLFLPTDPEHPGWAREKLADDLEGWLSLSETDESINFQESALYQMASTFTVDGINFINPTDNDFRVGKFAVPEDVRVLISQGDDIIIELPQANDDLIIWAGWQQGTFPVITGETSAGQPVANLEALIGQPHASFGLIFAPPGSIVGVQLYEIRISGTGIKKLRISGGTAFKFILKIINEPDI